MNKTALLLLLASPAIAFAQHSHGYIYVAPGAVTASLLGARGSTATLQIGAGGEAILGKGIGVGAELGALFPRGNIEGSVGIFSLDGYYHFLHGQQKADPFFAAGYTLGFRGERANLFNFGGGVNYWFIPHLGIKAELRDQVWTPSNATVHAWGFRFGLNFR